MAKAAKQKKAAKKPATGAKARPADAPARVVRMDPADLTAHPDLQIRAGGIDPAHVARLQAEIEGGATLDDIQAVELPPEDGRIVVTDGFHSRLAYIGANVGSVRVRVRKGTWTDALIAACGANRGHKPNLPRTDADKRNAVLTLQKTLADAGIAWSENRQAKHLGVSRGLLQVMKHGRPSGAKPPDPETPLPLADAAEPRPPVPPPPPAPDDWRSWKLTAYLKAADHIWEALSEAGVGTCGQLHDRLKAGDTFGLKGGDCRDLWGEVRDLGAAPAPAAEPAPPADPLAALDIPDDLRVRLTRDGITTLAELVHRLGGGETFDLSDDELGGLHVLCGLPDPTEVNHGGTAELGVGGETAGAGRGGVRNGRSHPADSDPVRPPVTPGPVYRPCPYLKPDGSHQQCDDPRQCRVCGGRGGLTRDEYDRQPAKVRELIDAIAAGTPPEPAHPFADLMQRVTGLARAVTLAMNAPGGERLKLYLSHAGLVEHVDKIVDGRHYGASFTLLRGLRRVIQLAGAGGREKSKKQVEHEYLADDSADAA